MIVSPAPVHRNHASTVTPEINLFAFPLSTTGSHRLSLGWQTLLRAGASIAHGTDTCHSSGRNMPMTATTLPMTTATRSTHRLLHHLIRPNQSLPRCLAMARWPSSFPRPAACMAVRTSQRRGRGKSRTLPTLLPRPSLRPNQGGFQNRFW